MPCRIQDSQSQATHPTGTAEEIVKSAAMAIRAPSTPAEKKLIFA